MAEIKPFKGVVYNGDHTGGDFSRVLAPPYDVISEAMRDKLYEINEYNVIRLILGKELEGDDDKCNKYTRAGRFFSEWLDNGVLSRDTFEHIYVYIQEYDYKNKKIRRAGFISLMKIGEEGNDPLLPHEKTLAKPKADRLNLIKEVKADLSPIFVLFYDDSGKIDNIVSEAVTGTEPFVDTFLDGVRHICWKIRDQKAIERISELMKDRKTFIADGHHRYEVAKQYRDLIRNGKPGTGGPADYVMVYFTNMADENGLTVLATHRVIKTMPWMGTEEIINRLSGLFYVKVAENLADLMNRLERNFGNNTVFGFFHGDKYYFVAAKDKAAILSKMKNDRKKEWKELDVSILHSVIFEHLLNIRAVEGNIIYVREAEKAVEFVKNGTHKAAFLMNPTEVEQLRQVAELGEMMPQKSTYFYPKLITGLVMNKLD